MQRPRAAEIAIRFYPQMGHERVSPCEAMNYALSQRLNRNAIGINVRGFRVAALVEVGKLRLEQPGEMSRL